MKELLTAAEFDGVLRQPYAVLFIFAEWGADLPALNGLLEQWEATSLADHPPTGTGIYSVHPWGFRHAHDGIHAQPQLQFRNAGGGLICLSARGTLVWLLSGVAVGVERQVLTNTVDDLNRRTLAAFR